ncbi:hypothetical protein ACFP8W_21260, partial [Nocardioides hankookensis]
MTSKTTTKLRLGVRALDRLMKSTPAMSVAKMTPEQLEKAQTTVIPDGGVAALLLGRLRKGVTVRTDSFPARGGDLPLRIYTPDAWSRTPRPVV